MIREREMSENDDDDERDRPFDGVVLCVSGLSREARLQVMRATGRLGGRYSPTLGAHCTHLLVLAQAQPDNTYKLNRALLMPSSFTFNIVTLPWLLHCLANNARLSESLFPFPSNSHSFSAISLYLDSHISPCLSTQLIQTASARGATFLPHSFLATHVVCEPSSIHSYLGHSSIIVTPFWVLKSTNDDNYLKRLVHISPDLARHLSSMLQDSHSAISGEALRTTSLPDEAAATVQSHERRQQLANSAKIGVRNRRARRMQTCQTPMRPITPTTLLDSICWSISEPTSIASIYTDSFSAERRTPEYFDAKGDGSDSESTFAHFTRPLKESETSEVIFRSNFLTILFPIDRFSEMGPSSTTFFSAVGFTCLQVLDHIYAFYQENMAVHEIEAAIHTDSRHADHLRLAYSSKETGERGYVAFKRIDFLGSRRSFEMLKRVSGDNNSNVYELLIRS